MWITLPERMSGDFITELIVRSATSDSRILDVGSGGGGLAIEVAMRAGCAVYGIDSSRFAVSRARRNAAARGISDRVIFERRRAENLGFPDSYFDLVYSVKTLHETRAGEALGEMHRVLREGGKLIIVDWVKGSLKWTFESYFSSDELELMVREAGFQLIETRLLGDVQLVEAERINR